MSQYKGSHQKFTMLFCTDNQESNKTHFFSEKSVEGKPKGDKKETEEQHNVEESLQYF